MARYAVGRVIQSFVKDTCPITVHRSHPQGAVWKPVTFSFSLVTTGSLYLSLLAQTACEASIAAGYTHTPKTGNPLTPKMYFRSIAGCFMWRRPFPYSDAVEALIERMRATHKQWAAAGKNLVDIF